MLVVYLKVVGIVQFNPDGSFLYQTIGILEILNANTPFATTTTDIIANIVFAFFIGIQSL